MAFGDRGPSSFVFHCSFINVGYIVLIDVLIYSAARMFNKLTYLLTYAGKLFHVHEAAADFL